MRFIIGFIFFGLLFYCIWLYFPEAFATLTSWAAQIVAYIQALFTNVAEKAHGIKPAPTPEKSLIPFFVFLSWLYRR